MKSSFPLVAVLCILVAGLKSQAQTETQSQGRFYQPPAQGQGRYYQPGRYYQQQAPQTQGRYYQQYSQSPAAQPASAVRNYSQVSPSQSTTRQAPAGTAKDYADVIEVGGMRRQYSVHVPARYRKDSPIPVVLVFHGLNTTGSLMKLWTMFDATAERNNFIVVYGEGVGMRWQDTPSGGVDDVGYVNAVLNRLISQYNIDQRRIYATGISNGGYFSQVLACAMPERIAAISVVASTMMRQTSQCCLGGRSTPAIFFLGTDDPLIAWADGKSRDLGKLGDALGLSQLGSIENPLVTGVGGVMTVPETIDFWCAHNHANGNPSQSQEPDRDPSDGTRVSRIQYGGGASEVVLYRIEGGGHSWPGSIRAATGLLGRTTQDIDASALTWDFFSRHTR